jgi:Heterokaryon incompatibility protein (HET)
MDRPLQYERHLTSGDEIRLIQLHPGHEGSPLKARIQYRHLSENPDYQALSYTWGSPFNQDHPSWNRYQVPATQHDLYMNNGVIKVTESLHSALLRLRQPVKALIFWVDAICIDQSHDEEKAWQIQQMREIYERAARVLIWLGPSDATSDIAMSVLQAGYRYMLRTQPYKRLGAIWIDAPQPKKGQEFDDQLNAASFGKMFGKVPESNVQIPDYPIKAVANLLNRAYWGRGWCWQEFTVAKKIAIVCGEKILEDGDVCIDTFLQTWDKLKEDLGGHPHGLDHRPWSMMELRRSYCNIGYLKNTGFKDNSSIETPGGGVSLGIWAHHNVRDSLSERMS